MTTLLYTDPIFATHVTPDGHPECVERIHAVNAALSDPRFGPLDRRTAPPARVEAIAAVHPPDHLEKLEAATPDSGLVALDADTALGPTTLKAARTAAGSAMAAVDAVMAGEARNAFVACRPPGHHAERSLAMGFCFLNHVAIAARHARHTHGLGRVAIVDFDVHHGNGTQDIFQADGSVAYVSTHQAPWYPGTGAASERGVGNILNLPMPAGTTGADIRSVFETAIMPHLEAFAPEFILLSAGFDSHRDDPLGDFRLSEDDFVWITQQMMDFADRHARGRLVSCLEGGYNLPALARSVAGHVATLAAL